MNVDQFEFEQWCDQYELNADTQKALQEQGFKSYKSLRHLDENKIKALFKKLQPAQLYLLIEGISILNPPPEETTVRAPAATEEVTPIAESADPRATLEAGQSLSAMQVLDLLRNNPAVAATFTPTASKTTPDRDQPGEAFLDPFQFGRGRFLGKCRSVPDYVSSLAKGEQPTTLTLGGVEFQTTANKKVAHDKLTMAQYMEGALRITRDMIAEDGANLDQVMDYINFLIQVAIFSQSFAWPSVLSYDKVYRKEQATLGFRWGTSSSFLMASHLQKPMQQPGHSTTARKPVTQVKDPRSGKTVCFKFNGYNGCNLKNCHFAHVCRSCFEDHPEVQHKTPPAPSKN